MKKISLVLALLLIFSLLASCNEGDTPPESTTTAVTTTEPATTTTTLATTQTSNKYSFVKGKTIPDNLADELDEFFMSIDSERWEQGITKTYPDYRIEYFGEHKYDIIVEYGKRINDVKDIRTCELTDSEAEALHAIIERAMNS